MNPSGGDQLQGGPNGEGYIFRANNEMTQNPQPSEYFNGAPAPFPYNTIPSSQPSQESPMNQQVPSSGNQSLFLLSEREAMLEDAMEIIEADERNGSNKECNVQQSNYAEINIFNHNAIAEQPQPCHTEYDELVATESEPLINHAMNAEIETFQNCSTLNGANQVNPRTPTPECMTEIWNEYEREEAWKKQKLNESEFLCNTSGFAVTPSQAAVPHSDVIHNHETGVNNNMQHGGYGLRQNFENPQNLIASIQISSTNRVHQFSGDQLQQNSTINSVNNFNNDIIPGRIQNNEANHIQNLYPNLNLERYRNSEGTQIVPTQKPIQKKKNQIQSPRIQNNNETSSSSSKSTAPQKTRGAPKRFTDEENRIRHNNSVKECAERKKTRIAQNDADVGPLENRHQNLLRDLQNTLEEYSHYLNEAEYENIRRQLENQFPYLNWK